MASRDKLMIGREDINSQQKSPTVMASRDTPTTGRDGHKTGQRTSFININKPMTGWYGHRHAGSKLKQGRLAGIDPCWAGTCNKGLIKTLVNLFRKAASKPQSHRQLGGERSYYQVCQVRERPLLYIVLGR
jgi:hypothetical protein